MVKIFNEHMLNQLFHDYFHYFLFASAFTLYDWYCLKLAAFGMGLDLDYEYGL